MVKRIVMAALLLAALAGSAWAQTQREDGQSLGAGGTGTGSLPQPIVPSLIGGISRADSVSRALTVTSSGATVTSEEAPNRDYWTYFSKVYNDTISTAGRNADSTGVFPVWPYRRMALCIAPTGIYGTAGGTMLVAVQIRAHFTQTADSSSTFPLRLFTGANALWQTTAAVGDTIGHLALENPATASAAGQAANGEFVLLLRPDVDMTTIAGRAPKNIYIPLPPDLFIPYMSVRIRILNQLTSTGGAGMRRGRFDITFVGSAN